MANTPTFKEFYEYEANRLIGRFKPVVPEGAVMYFKDEGTEQGKVIGPITLDLKQAEGKPPRMRPFGSSDPTQIEFGWNYKGVAERLAKVLNVRLVVT